MSLPSLAEVDHADWPALQALCVSLGLNPKGRSGVVRTRVMDHVRRRTQPTAWRPDATLQASLLTRLGFPDPAVRLWESTIELDAPAPWIGLGRAHLAAGDLEEATKCFERAAQMGDSMAHLHRAEALAAGGKYDAAAQACDAFLASRSGDLRGLVLKAGFLARGGWTSEAAAVIRTAFESHPDARELWRGLGSILLRGGKAEAAAEAFHEATRADPEDVDAWVNRGAALLAHGRPKESIGALREALELDPHRAVALNDLGVAYLQSGQAKSAAVNLERAAKRLEAPRVLLNVAEALEALGERSAALEMYRRVLRLKPKDAEAGGAMKRLAPAKVPSRPAPRRPRPRESARRAKPRKAARRARRKKAARKPTRRVTPRKRPATVRPRRRLRPKRRPKKQRAPKAVRRSRPRPMTKRKKHRRRT